MKPLSTKKCCGKKCVLTCTTFSQDILQKVLSNPLHNTTHNTMSQHSSCKVYVKCVVFQKSVLQKCCVATLGTQYSLVPAAARHRHTAQQPQQPGCARATDATPSLARRPCQGAPTHLTTTPAYFNFQTQRVSTLG